MKKVISVLMLLILCGCAQQQDIIKFNSINESKIVNHFGGLSVSDFNVNSTLLEKEGITGYKIVGAYYKDNHEVEKKELYDFKLADYNIDEVLQKEIISSIELDNNQYVLRISSEGALYPSILLKQKSAVNYNYGFSMINNITSIIKKEKILLNGVLLSNKYVGKETVVSSVEELQNKYNEYIVIYLVFI